MSEIPDFGRPENLWAMLLIYAIFVTGVFTTLEIAWMLLRLTWRKLASWNRRRQIRSWQPRPRKAERKPR